MDRLSTEYQELLISLKQRIRTSQIRAALAVNRELILLYWQIGREILLRQSQQGWGAKVIEFASRTLRERLSQDLQAEFPELKGLSGRNLKYMRAFAEAYPEDEFVQQLVAQIPWGHNVVLLDRVKDSNARLWYAQQVTTNGWSRNILAVQIESQLYQRQGQAVTNFEATLPPDRSDLVRATLKDPYLFDFLSLGKEAQERELENALVQHIEKFLLELGAGFAFVGKQFPLEVGGQDFRLDLLFYHLKLRCYVVIELKVDEFKPEYAGKLNFYLSAVDDLLRHPDDEPTIGILLCRSKNGVVAEYALRDINKPMGVAQWTQALTKSLPDPLVSKLPSIEELEAELGAIELGAGSDG
jgi:predicted nuclease of restriction endonuclease-like (RecB) superfamily